MTRRSSQKMIRLFLECMLGNNPAVLGAKLTILEGDVRYSIVILHFNFHVLPEKSSCPKPPAFKTRHGPHSFQAASKQNRHVACNNKARLHALLQLFSKIARCKPQNIDFTQSYMFYSQFELSCKITYNFGGKNHILTFDDLFESGNTHLSNHTTIFYVSYPFYLWHFGVFW